MDHGRGYVEKDLAGVSLVAFDFAGEVAADEVESFALRSLGKGHLQLTDGNVFEEAEGGPGSSQAVDAVPDLPHQFDGEVVERQSADEVLVDTFAGHLLNGGVEETHRPGLDGLLRRLR